ncbi:LlaJI family restriction endonuclease [Paenibacillus sp. LMG 31458]|uniref:LlaJI family restriction endonuclease n=1 Tax=Paenibacillus phytorum TaxID=2654977 RepID=A0ABX1Y0H2_9BACL|nr:LlaJI family restriction endonuclease [Paenibacillus phytorum]NOU73989.1 LlaJI family restriction endonuclease [Paenibacillus phytorum]
MKSRKIRDLCFIESKEYSLDKYELPQKLLLNSDIITKKDSKFYFNLTGFLVHNDNIFIVFPKNHKIPDDEPELLEHIRTLAGVLLRYQNETSLEENENELLFGNTSNDTAEGIAASLWIIRDYIEYGLIQRQFQSNTLSGSNIDWTRTINTSHPIFSSSGVVYTTPKYRKKSLDLNNILRSIHEYVVLRSFQKYGWILGYNTFDNVTINEELPCNEELATYLLSKELNSIFNDREIKLMNTLIEFINGSDNKNQKTTLDTLATNYFHNVWEAMCSFVFRNEYKTLKKYIPKPIWHLSDNRTESTHQRPDILIVRQNKLYILDAKYYNTPKSLPGWQDLVKQFFYAYSLKHKFRNMVNVLLFPSTVDDLLEFYGYVDIQNQPSLGKIQSFSLDTLSLMKDYSNYQYGRWMDVLILKINCLNDNAITSTQD